MFARFEWDPMKAAANLRKHGISFDEAAAIFADPNAVFDQDREVDGEERWQVIGCLDDTLMLTVAHTVRDEDDTEIYRIISARQADRRERRRYERENGQV